jgi:nascent polypeptide-associated complex subunit alpha
MFGKINPKQIEGMMKKMGISQQSIAAKRVIIELEDENLVIDEPNVTKVNMQGQETYQIMGETHSESRESFSEEDVKVVMEKTKVSREQVIKFLKENNGDIALAIIELKK